MARLAPEQHYPTDLTDTQWALVQPHLTTHTGPGAPTTVNLRQMVNGILYLTRTGCQWRLLPATSAPGAPSATTSILVDGRWHLGLHQ